MTIDISAVTFGVEPPPAEATEGFSSKYSEIIEAIKKHAARAEADPNLSEWCQLPGKHPLSTASNWRSGRYAGTEPGEFDAVVRNLEVHDDYVRTPQGEPKLDEHGERVPKKRRLGDLYLRYLGPQGIALAQELSEGELNSLSPFLDLND